ncbi:MAG: NAD-glutamate dehydrogenase [Pseudomonadales bacterium]
MLPTDYGRAIASELAGREQDIEPKLLQAFALEFWRGVQPDDLVARNKADDAELTLQAWHAFSAFDVDQPIIEVLPPTSDNAHSVLRILHRDMPFITDSVLLELARADLALHYLHNVTLSFERGPDGIPHSINTNSITEQSSGAGMQRINETLIYAELLPFDDDRAEQLLANLKRTLSDVRAVVDDYHPMRDKALALAAQLVESPDSDFREAAEFLRWLCQDHFTFMGFRSFDFSGGAIEQEASSTLGFLSNRPQASRRGLASIRESTRDFLLEPTPLSFSKAGTPSRVHRPAYPDYIGVKRFDANGQVIGEDGFLGLYTSPVYSAPPQTIPVVRRKVASVLEQAGYAAGSYDYKSLKQILATYPRDALFQTPTQGLYETAASIAHIHERRQTKVFLWRGRYGMFFNCLVYLPRDALNTRVRQGIQDLLQTRLCATDVEFESFFSESVLVRLQYILRVDPMQEISYDLKALEAEIMQISADWRIELGRELSNGAGKGSDRALMRSFVDAFPSDYQERFDLHTAVYDIGHLSQLADESDLRLRFYRPADASNGRVNLKLFKRGDLLPLSQVVPVLENLGFHVVSEHPYQLHTGDTPYTIQDVTLARQGTLDLSAVGELFEAAFKAIWDGAAESDPLNGLVVDQQLDWQAVALLRSYARYMKQAAFGFEQTFIASTLLNHGVAARLLIQHFTGLLHPQQRDQPCREEFETYLAQIELLNEDRVLRQLLALIDATVRTNYFTDRADESLIVHKLSPAALVGLPEPKPLYEIFVYAPHMEGVHLRSSKVARGGIRWSDRLEDYRTEVLGLVKAQIVKNAVIVPSGAKGGFVLKAGAGIEAGIAAYRQLIGGMLAVTDNLIDGRIVPPADVHRRDDDDPYLVVAADKGTASFSDIANEIAIEQGFWLGDAFASGGSVGYDHKKMGITARGAWISVQRHFRSLGIDPQNTPFTVVGIGDMGGDVFGNGMLQSRCIKLLAAFNHLHIFVDPDPDPEAAFEERLRLFDLPRSSWSNYETEKISAGGGVFSRTQKAIPVSPQMREAFGIIGDNLAGDDLISQILKAPVDLIWNGGIGTYVKAQFESHGDAGDRANDALRVNGAELQARIVGEGGNLGLTHAGRIEYAMNQGLVNADFIDNAGGVDCSDHEVNLKVLLSAAIADKSLSQAARVELLMAQEDAVAELVLHNNFVQARCLTLATEHSVGRVDEYNRLASALEEHLDFDRSEADFPTEETLAERTRSGQGLVLPEMATLLGYAKIMLKHQLTESRFTPGPALATLALNEFPESVVVQLGDYVPAHRLHAEIVITQLANDIIGFAGVSFVNRIMEFVGCEAADVVRAYWTCAELFDLRTRVDWLDNAELPVGRRRTLLLDLIRLCRRVTRWLVRNHRTELDPERLITRYRSHIDALLVDPDALFLSSGERLRHVERAAELDISEAPVAGIALGFDLFGALAVAEAAARANAPAVTTGPIYRSLGKLLKIDGLTSHLAGMTTASHWRAMERDALLDDLCERQMAVTEQVLHAGGSIAQWQSDNEAFVNQWLRIVEDVPLAPDQEFAGLSMTVRKLIDLSRRDG